VHRTIPPYRVEQAANAQTSLRQAKQCTALFCPHPLTMNFFDAARQGKGRRRFTSLMTGKTPPKSLTMKRDSAPENGKFRFWFLAL
jgi:hypothetical protein